MKTEYCSQADCRHTHQCPQDRESAMERKERDVNAMWELVAKYTAAELAKMVVSERARRCDDQRFADGVVSQRDAAVAALAALRRDRAALLAARVVDTTDTLPDDARRCPVHRSTGTIQVMTTTSSDASARGKGSE